VNSTVDAVKYQRIIQQKFIRTKIY
ncbi:unnamed protein product, partial [Rotaria socialis]